MVFGLTSLHLAASESDEGPHIKRVKEHKVNQKPSGMSKMLRLSEMGELGGGNNDYKEDTRLEDRLALEAEEEKKYETGEGYGGGGGNGGGWDDGTKGVNWATNIQRQDAAEVFLCFCTIWNHSLDVWSFHSDL